MLAYSALRTCEENKVFFDNKFKSVDVVDVNNCLEQIKYMVSVYTCEICSELPHNVPCHAIVRL